MMAALSLLLLLAMAGEGFAQRRWLAKEEVEAGGWFVAYGNELSEEEAARGAVESWVSLQSGDRESIRTWANTMLQQAIALMVSARGPATADGFSRDEQRDARRFGVETVRDLLGSRAAGAQILNLGSLDFKAGVIEYRERGRGYERRHRAVVFMPYFALRPRYSRHHRFHNRGRDSRGEDGWRDNDGYEDDAR